MGATGRRIRQRLRQGAQPPVAQACEHLRDAPADAEPRTPGECAACTAQGTSWVDLRMCLTCGEVGCCDSSPWKHAAVHAADAGHPVMRSHERGESWRWCYVDEMLG